MSLNYVMLGSNDVKAARGFYDAVLPVIGGRLVAEHMPHAFCYELRGGGRIWVATPFDERQAVAGNGNMVGLACQSTDEVNAAYSAALTQGGSSEGEPGLRPQYGPEFYAAYVRDLDGNKMSFVYLGEEQV
ncbi:MAG: VOC family protein [Pseudomonadota bacterium]